MRSGRSNFSKKKKSVSFRNSATASYKNYIASGRGMMSLFHEFSNRFARMGMLGKVHDQDLEDMKKCKLKYPLFYIMLT
jgi:hypothetical protein